MRVQRRDVLVRQRRDGAVVEFGSMDRGTVERAPVVTLFFVVEIEGVQGVKGRHFTALTKKE